MVGLILTCLVLLGLAYWISQKPFSYWRKKGVIHVDPRRWWARTFGVFLAKKSLHDVIIDVYKEYPDKRYFGSSQFFRPSLFVRDLDLIKRITVKDFDHFTDHPNVLSDNTDQVLRLNLFFLEGEKWKDMRSTLSPTFTSSKMRIMYALIQETADNFAKHFLDKAKDQVIELEMRSTFSKFTNDVIANCAFGVQCDSLKNDKNEFYRMATRVTTMRAFNVLKSLFAALFPSISKFFKISLFPTSIVDFFRDLIKEMMATREANKIVRPDMIHLLMESKKGRLRHDAEARTPDVTDAGFATVDESPLGGTLGRMELTDDVITAQALIFFFAGFSTISTTLTFLSYRLAVDEAVQARLRREVDDVIDASSLEKGVYYEAIAGMRYLDQVVSETLRMHSPGFALGRVCVKDYLIEAKEEGETDLMLDKGVFVTIPSCAIHMDPKFFPDPQRFDPDRFSDENKGKIVPGSYLPFGAGPRNCIGSRFALLETKALVVSLLRHFEIVPVKGTTIPFELSKTIDLNIKGGCWLGLKKRT